MNNKLNSDNTGFSLRSEKVRNLMGEIPSSLIRYGMLSIVLVLLVFFITASIIPYNRIYSGETVNYKILEINKDSVRVSLLLKFEKNNFNNSSSKCRILLMTDDDPVVGQVISIDYSLNLENARVSQCVFLLDDFNSIRSQISEFKLVISNGSILKNIFVKNAKV